MRQAQDMLTSYKQPVTAEDYPGDFRSLARFTPASVRK
jgi:hypothetical protein